MAIEFARIRYVKRSDGGNACRSAAYNARSDLKSDRTGERFFFAHRDPVLSHSVLLPDGASAKFQDIAYLWNQAQAAERRKDSQEAKEILLALPTDPGLGIEDWQVLAEEFAREHFVSKGVAVQVDIHPPHEGEVNVHAHLLITTRRIEGERFADHKARDLDPEVRTMKGGMKAVTEAERWGVLWRDAQNRYFELMGLDIRVDEIGVVAQRHEGPVRMRTRPTDADARLEETRAANEQALRDPTYIIDTLTRRRATFSELDIERLLKKHIPDAAERTKIRAEVLAQPSVVGLHDRSDQRFSGRYTVREVREQEVRVVASAGKIATKRQAVDSAKAQSVAQEMNLDAEQYQAFSKATGTDGFVVIEGLAGTGKSHSLAAVREAYERAGWRVVGLAPTNTAAEGLRRGGFTHASTVHLELFYMENGRFDRAPAWNRQTLVIVDEAAMLDTRTYERLMSRAAETGARVVLAGDDRQLGSVERGGMFSILKEAHGSTVITKVRRQEADWQRMASEDFSDGRIPEGLRAYAEHGHIHWSPTIDESRARLISDWDQNSRERPTLNRFVYAGTNAQVNQLNDDIRAIRLKRGEVRDEVECDTVRGKIKIGAGDRIQFHGNDRKGGIYNGSLATIEKIDKGWIRARTDTGRVVTFEPKSFDKFGLGYAGTIYRGQGKTQTEVFALYDNIFAWNARTAYVGLTRHQTRVELYVSRDLAENEVQLGMQMSRRFRDEASLAWATRDEIERDKARGTGDKGRGDGGREDSGSRGSDTSAQPPTGPLPRQEIEALRRIDLAAYARDVHGFSVSSRQGSTTRFDLQRPDGKGGIDRIEVRKNADGHWTFRDPARAYQRGDILDLARREGAHDLTVARRQVADYLARSHAPATERMPEPSPAPDIQRTSYRAGEGKDDRQRYDALKKEQEKAMEKTIAPDRNRDAQPSPAIERPAQEQPSQEKSGEKKLTFMRDRNPDRDRSR